MTSAGGSFLKLMGASLALAGLTACTRQPINEIVPYVRQPEEVIPGKPLFFATAMEHDGFATGLLVESHEGHPTKIEGNPDHPASLGATSIFDQASILGLYDPDRSQSILNAGNISTWGAFLSAINSPPWKRNLPKTRGRRSDPDGNRHITHPRRANSGRVEKISSRPMAPISADLPR